MLEVNLRLILYAYPAVNEQDQLLLIETITQYQ